MQDKPSKTVIWRVSNNAGGSSGNMPPGLPTLETEFEFAAQVAACRLCGLPEGRCQFTWMNCYDALPVVGDERGLLDESE